MSKNLVLTKLGKLKLEKELEDLQKKQLPKIIKQIEYAKDLGDLSENAEYHEAKDKQGMIVSRIRDIKEILKTADVASDSGNGNGHIKIGSKIVIELEGTQKEYELVGFSEQNPSEGKISNESPLGQAFIGKKKGDIAEINAPKGIIKAKVLDVK